MRVVSTQPNSAPTRSFGESLLRYRRAAGLSQADLARTSGMSVRALRELERGRAAAAQERSAELLATALGLTGGEHESFIMLAREGRRRSTRSRRRTMLYSLPSTPRLVGRRSELDRLSELAARGGGVVVVGAPGVGKTTLAVSAANHLADRFPDGCIALDLRGIDDQPIAPAEALERMLTALGVPSSRVPAETSERSSLFKALTRERKMLVVLDNVLDEKQVAPLLPGSGTAFTIVTSRRVLTGLETAATLPLDVLTAADAIELLSVVAGESAVRRELKAAHEVVELCGRLPLAVRIAANRLSTSRQRSIDDLARQLGNERRRLDSLAAGDLSLRSVFEVSLRRLSPGAQALFRRLALIPGAHFGPELAAIAAGVQEDEIESALHELVAASLLTTTSAPPRHQFHDLIRLFAREHLLADEPEAQRLRLYDDLCAHVLAKGAVAGRLFFPDSKGVADDSPFRSQADAAEWLEREATSWRAVQRSAAETGRFREVFDFTWSVNRYSLGREMQYDWGEIFGIGLAAARELGDQTAEVDMLTQLGSALTWSRSDFDGAVNTLREALTLSEKIGYHRGTTVVNASLGMALMRVGRLDEAVAYNQRAYEMSAGYEFFDVRFWMTLALSTIFEAQGQFEKALALHRPLRAEAERSFGDTNVETARLVTLLVTTRSGACLAGLSRWEEAAKSFHEARKLAFVKEAGYGGEAELALLEGTAWRMAGEHEHARTCLLLARDLLDGPAWEEDRTRVKAELALLEN